jgi:hypothetical protein
MDLSTRLKAQQRSAKTLGPGGKEMVEPIALTTIINLFKQLINIAGERDKARRDDFMGS